MARPQPGLEGQVVVVAGGSGTVGSGIVYEFLKCGAKVIVPLRGESSAKNLQAELDGSGSKGELDTFTCVVSDEASCTEFAKYINDKYGKIDHVVSTLGGGCKELPLSQYNLADLREHMTDRVESHYVAYSKLYPLLKDTGSYTFITGGLASFCPAPGCSMMTVTNAAVVGLFKGAQAEAKGTGKCINELRICTGAKKRTSKGEGLASNEIGRVCTLIATSGLADMELKITGLDDIEGLISH